MKKLKDILEFISKDTIYEKLDLDKVNLKSQKYDRQSIKKLIVTSVKNYWQRDIYLEDANASMISNSGIEKCCVWVVDYDIPENQILDGMKIILWRNNQISIRYKAYDLNNSGKEYSKYRNNTISMNIKEFESATSYFIEELPKLITYYNKYKCFPKDWTEIK